MPVTGCLFLSSMTAAIQTRNGALSALAEEFDEVRVLRRPVNGGEGRGA